MTSEQAQQAEANALGIPLEIIQGWAGWVDNAVAHLKAKQREDDAQLQDALKASSSWAIPGASYGSTMNKGMTILLVGALGTRKTTWAAQWPSPFFLTMTSEGGDDALIPYPKIACTMLSRCQQENALDPPPVFNVLRPPSKECKTIEEFNSWVNQIKQQHRQWKIATVVIDGLNYLMDMWISEHTFNRRKNKVWVETQRSGKVDLMRPPDWGMLDAWLRDVRNALGNEGLNLIWTVHERPRYEADDTDMMKQDVVEYKPLISGKQYITLPGACKLIIRAEKTLQAHPTAMGRMVALPAYWTSPEFKAQNIRNKYYDAFPLGRLDDPVFKVEPTFRGLWNELHNFIYLGP